MASVSRDSSETGIPLRGYKLTPDCFFVPDRCRNRFFELCGSVICLGVRCSVLISVSHGNKKPMECMRLRRERPVFMGRWQNFQVLELDRSLPVKAKGTEPGYLEGC